MRGDIRRGVFYVPLLTNVKKTCSDHEPQASSLKPRASKAFMAPLLANLQCLQDAGATQVRVRSSELRAFMAPLLTNIKKTWSDQRASSLKPQASKDFMAPSLANFVTRPNIARPQHRNTPQPLCIPPTINASPTPRNPKRTLP